MRGTDKIVRILLASMILLSLFLTWKIWTNSGSKEIQKDAALAENVTTAKNPDEVFLPVKIIKHDNRGKHFYTNKEGLITNVHKELLKLDVGKLKLVGQKNRDKYIEIQTRKNSYELVFSNPLSFDYYEDIYKLKKDKKMDKAATFQRIVLATDTNKIYLLDDDGYAIYEGRYTKDGEAIKTLIEDKNNRFMEVSEDRQWLPKVYSYKDPVKLKKYSYILATQSYTMFSKAFFKSEEEIFSNDDDKNTKDVELMNYAGETMHVKYANGEVKFSGRFIVDEDEKDKEPNIYRDSFQYVEKVGASLGTLRYFDRTDQRITYRNYVEGYPIFSDYSKGRIEITLLNQNVQISTNQETIQVPIPSDEEVTLQPTGEVVEELVEAGLPIEEISDLQIGYTWETNEETKQVVDLLPEWYVKYKGNWETVAKTISIFEDEDDQGGEK